MGETHTEEHHDNEHHGLQLLSRVNLSNRTPFTSDLQSAFGGGFDIGVQNHFDHGRGHNEFYLTPGLSMGTNGNLSAMLTANAHSKYVFDSGFLLSGGLHVGGESELLSFGSEVAHDDHHGDDHHDAGHDAGHGDHHGGVHFHGATEAQAGYQFDVGNHSKLALTGGGGVQTDFSHVNPYVTVGSTFEKGNHRVGVNLQYGQDIPVTTNLTWTIAIGGGGGH